MRSLISVILPKNTHTGAHHKAQNNEELSRELLFIACSGSKHFPSVTRREAVNLPSASAFHRIQDERFEPESSLLEARLKIRELLGRVRAQASAPS